jgi:O-antigen/teichoic acid export membrane protein
MSLSRRVGSGAALQIGARLFSALASFLVGALLLARSLPEAEYGRFSFWHTLFLLALTLCDFGVHRAAIRAVAAGELPLPAALAAARRIKGAIGIGCFALMALAALAFEAGDLGSRGLLVLAASHALFFGLSSGSIAFEADVDFKVPALGVALSAAIFAALGLLLHALGVASAEPYLVAYGAGAAAQSVYLQVAAARRVAPSRAIPATTRRLFSEALPIGISAVAVSIYYYCDTLLLRPLASEEEVARYSVAYRLMTFALMAPVLFSQVLFPVFARCAATSNGLLRRAVERATYYLAFGAAAAAGAFHALAPDLLAFVYGETYRDQGALLSVLALAMTLVFLAYPHTTALIAAGRAASFTRITIAAAALDVALNLVFVPTYLALGAAWTTVASEGLVLCAGVIALRRHFGIDGFTVRLAAPLGVFAAQYGTLTLLHDQPIVARILVALLLPLLLAFPLRILPFRLGIEEVELR